MGNELFDNVGKYIKGLAKTIFYWILTPYILFGIAAIICGIALMDAGSGIGAIGLLIGFAIFAVGYGVAKLKVAEMYAYGEMADRLISIDSKLSPNRKSHKSNPVPVKIEEETDDQTPHRTTSWECPFCGCENLQDSRFCKSCGTEDIGI